MLSNIVDSNSSQDDSSIGVYNNGYYYSSYIQYILVSQLILGNLGGPMALNQTSRVGTCPPADRLLSYLSFQPGNKIKDNTLLCGGRGHTDSTDNLPPFHLRPCQALESASLANSPYNP